MASQVMVPAAPPPVHDTQTRQGHVPGADQPRTSLQTIPTPTSQQPQMTQLILAHSQLSSHTAKRVHREVRFGAYILGSTLGEGEFGKVKLGWRKDGRHPSQVAIKLIKRDSILKDLELEIKIHREINSLKMLNHPNIVNLVEVMKSGKYIGIVLEYASGGELFDYILHHKYLKENTAKKLFAQLISGVDYMHSKGLIHRDLKLENLLLDKHKNIIISDFGFVNSYNREKNDLMKTSCGSPCYAAPELVLTQTPYEGRKVDIWSLGVILYAMLAGYLPFDDDPENEDGADIIRLYHYICKTPLTFPEYVSPLARDLLRKIIVPDPKKRININEIRGHPWLMPHAPFLAMRQPDWDRIHKEKSVPGYARVPPVQNKRFSMINEKTNSSSLMMQDLKPLMSYGPNVGNYTAASANTSTASGHTRSYSSTSISQLYSSPSISSSLANAVAKQDHKSPETASDSGNDSLTPSPTKAQYTRGHAKAASASYTLASTALKAMVDDSSKNPMEVKRSSIVTDKPYNFPTAPLPRSTTYTGTPISTPVSTTYTGTSSTYTGTPISTIVELPTRTAVQPTQPLAKPYVANNPREPSRLPHATKKPRPTSYHPLSMSSLLMGSNGSPPSLLEYIKIPSPINAPIPQFMSTSPTKALSVSETTEENVRMSPIVSHASRRNSVVTHVHVNGVLSNDSKSSAHPSPEQRGSSVLSYLEDKMDALDLAESPTKSPAKPSAAANATVTPQINQLPTFDVQTKTLPTESVPARTSRELTPELSSANTFGESPISLGVAEPVVIAEAPAKKPVVTTVQSLVPPPPSEVEAKTKPDKKKKKEEVVAKSRTKEKKSDKVKRSSSVQSRRESSKENKENIVAKEQKKRNRFSLLSLYSNYNSNVETPSSLTASVVSSRKALEDITATGPQSSHLHYKNSSASSSSASVPTLNSQQFTAGSGSTGTAAVSAPGTAQSSKEKRVNSNSSSNSRKSTTSGTSSSASGKEASAARKVMDFFKRRSVRLG